MAITGDFSRLQQLRQRLERIAAGGLMPDIGRELADEAHRLVINAFNQQRDPWGRPWRPLKDKSQHDRPILQKTRRLLRGITARYQDGRIVLRMSGYGAFQQFGTDKIPARKFVPEGAALGPIWGDAFLRVTGRVVRQMLGIS
jgi:phage gpG-like protein